VALGDPEGALVERMNTMTRRSVESRDQLYACIRIDLANGDRIGPGKIALLEAIRTKGSISEAARHLGMAY
jgi:hypothetical protein